MRKLIAIMIGLVVVVSFGGDAFAANGGNSATKRDYTFWGTVESVVTDADASTTDSFNMLIEKANGNAKRLGIVGGASEYVTMTVADATDLAMGDDVKVTARYDGTGFVALKVKEKAAK